MDALYNVYMKWFNGSGEIFINLKVANELLYPLEKDIAFHFNIFESP